MQAFPLEIFAGFVRRLHLGHWSPIPGLLCSAYSLLFALLQALAVPQLLPPVGAVCSQK